MLRILLIFVMQILQQKGVYLEQPLDVARVVTFWAN